jgi:hypothetical protein
MHIGFDVDEVVVNYIDPFLNFVNGLNGTNFTRHNMTTFSFEDSGIIPKGKNEEYVQKFGDSGNLRTLPLMHGAKFLIDLLLKKGHDITLITSRDSKYQEDTLDNLQEYEVDVPVYFCNPERPKSLFIQNEGIHVFFDDSPKFIREIYDNTKAFAILMTEIPGSINDIKQDGKVSIIIKNWADVYPVIAKIKSRVRGSR